MNVNDHLTTWEAPITEFPIRLGNDNYREDLSGKVLVAKSDTSAVTLIESRNKVLVCLSCPLSLPKADFRTSKPALMFAHLEVHRGAGQDVPFEVRNDLFEKVINHRLFA